MVRANGGEMTMTISSISDRSAACSLEMDNIVRGVKAGEPGIMAHAMVTLMDWAEEKLGPREIYLRVFENNAHAISFYEKLGFIRDRLLPLTKHRDGPNVSYQP